MSARLLIDTGPIVAFFNRSDSHHDWAVEQFARLRPPLLTCDAVLSEACFLLRGAGVAALPLEAVARGAILPDFSISAEIESIRRLMKRYEDIGVSLADACLVRMSELHTNCKVLTIDRDFLIYRRDGRRTIPLIAPFDS